MEDKNNNNDEDLAHENWEDEDEEGWDVEEDLYACCREKDEQDKEKRAVKAEKEAKNVLINNIYYAIIEVNSFPHKSEDDKDYMDNFPDNLSDFLMDSLKKLYDSLMEIKTTREEHTKKLDSKTDLLIATAIQKEIDDSQARMIVDQLHVTKTDGIKLSEEDEQLHATKQKKIQENEEKKKKKELEKIKMKSYHRKFEIQRDMQTFNRHNNNIYFENILLPEKQPPKNEVEEGVHFPY